MWAYIVRRVAIGLALLMALTLVTFALFFASPVDPARFACGKNCNEAQRDVARKALGYDLPVHEQWTQFMKGVVVGRDYPADPELRAANPSIVTHCEAPCLGYSHLNAATVNDLVGEAAPVTVSLALVALVMWLVGGVLFGILAAVFKGSIIDRGIVGLTLVAYAFPTFFIGVFLLKFVVIKWEILPYPEYYSIADAGVGTWLAGVLLPAAVLALVFTAGYVRMTRAFVIESMSEDYIRTARAKGLNGRSVLFKHGIRAALTPLVTMAGLDFATLLGGAIITESVFSYEGLGLLTLQASEAYDLPTIIGVVVLAGTFVIVANIIVDILYAVIDPRVRLG
ncbi:ABC transporter permease [Nocardioides daphniae]|uniref:ABC transporter permease n=1 Tax=Nocardioides daphniae TaxID=402297 RepID=A0A4P7UAU9_9ACTN|nr:ABC transporter permease [Nocardioides daphniae]QCC77223.1 ABC transporter permease [Nocardioides daphniae]GGD26500.1 ABC transporter permease [Nocardioides daphniae]